MCVAVRASFFPFTVPTDPIQWVGVDKTSLLAVLFPSPLGCFDSVVTVTVTVVATATPFWALLIHVDVFVVVVALCVLYC